MGIDIRRIKMKNLILSYVENIFSKQGISNILECFLPALLKLQARKWSPIVIYHSVDIDTTNPLITGKIHNIEPKMFYHQCCLLKKYYTIVPIDELAKRVKERKKVNKLAAITFDDGYASVLRNAVPVLEELNVPATFFLSTKLVQSGAFWRDKVRYVINQNLVGEFLRFAGDLDPVFKLIHSEKFYRDTKNPSIVNSHLMEVILDEFLMHKGVALTDFAQDVYCTTRCLTIKRFSNLTFGNHSHSHYVLSSMNRDEQYREILTAKKVLQNMKLPLSRLFAIPFGGMRDFNSDTLDILRDLDYSGYVLSSGGRVVNAVVDTNDMKENNDLIVLRRFMQANKRLFLFEE